MRCSRCGHEREGRERTCPVCGHRRRSPVAVALIVAAVVLAVALLAAGGLFLWYRLSDRPLPAAPSAGGETQPTTAPVVNTVTVTVPEGYTVRRIAALMEQNGVCAAADFLTAVQEADISDYAFAAGLPSAEGRVYRLEGYLYPDTYEFYKDCSGEAAVRRFLDNFARKWDTLQESAAAGGLTMDEAVTLASIIQWEAGRPADMQRVSRVLRNRLESPDYPRLQCDTTTKYLRELAADGVEADENAYSTYICRGLPIGAINCPGLDALTAAVSPSEEEICAGCFFFVTDAANDTVYYSRTYAEHLAACREHKLGSFAE